MPAESAECSTFRAGRSDCKGRFPLFLVPAQRAKPSPVLAGQRKGAGKRPPGGRFAALKSGRFATILAFVGSGPDSAGDGRAPA
jgi:hypothetical protein